MPVDYLLCGLRVRADRPIPGVVAAVASGPADVAMTLGEMPPWVARLGVADWEPWIGVSEELRAFPGLRGWKLRSGSHYMIKYGDDTSFLVDATGQEVWGAWPEPLGPEDVVPYILGPILGFLLRLRARVCLHASAFVAPQGAIALLGPAGAGKSTTAAAFAQRGFALLTDDIVLIKENAARFYLEASYAQLKLWPDSVAALFGSPDYLPRISPNDPTWDKRYAGPAVGGLSFSAQSAPLTATYVLQPRTNDSSAPFTSDLRPRERLTALLQNTYATQYTELKARADAFRVLARLASSIHMAAVTPHTNTARLGQLCDVILGDLSRRS